MKYFWKHIALLSVVIGILMLQGCSAELNRHEEGLIPTKEGGKVLQLTLQVQNALRANGTPGSTRAVGEEPGNADGETYGSFVFFNGHNVNPDLNENKIERVALFIFKADGTLIKAFSDQDLTKVDPNADATAEGAYRVRMTLSGDEASEMEKAPITLVALANAATDITTGVTTLAELQAKVADDTGKLDIPDIYSPTPQPLFLMDGVLVAQPNWGIGTVNEKDLYSITVPIQLKRALAKIRLRLYLPSDDPNNQFLYGSDGSGSKFFISPDPNESDRDSKNGDPDIYVKLVHYPEKGKVLSTNAPYTHSDKWQAEWKTTKWRPLYRIIKDQDTGETLDYLMPFPFYAHEHEWSSNELERSYLLVRIGISSDKYPDPITYYYYKIPINYRLPMDGVPEEKLHKMERNHIYDITSHIDILGSLSEEDAMEVESNVSITPWISGQVVNGTIDKVEYLVVDELDPIMANTSVYHVDYSSSLPVEIEMKEVSYQYYDMRGDFYSVTIDADGNKVTKDSQGATVKEEKTNIQWDAAKVTPSSQYLKDGVLKIEHPIPVNYTYYNIKFTVKQIGGTLSQDVHVKQYPPIYITGERSTGFGGNNPDGADFRYHSTLGIMATYQGGNTPEAQRNEIFNRITVKVPDKEFLIGDPVDPVTKKTRTDSINNRLVSPEFIIASQHGQSISIPQSGATQIDFPVIDWHEFGAGYGPHATNRYPKKSPYYTNTSMNAESSNVIQAYRTTYKDAEDRCFNYFEGEYGTDGTYTEWYIDELTRQWKSREVEKTFKYQGRWRIPTLAEVTLIAKIQDDPETMTKGLMFGTLYWTAQEGVGYWFKEKREEGNNPKMSGGWEPFVRCVFDTSHLDDKE